MTRVELLPSHLYKAVVRTYNVLLRDVFQMTVRLLSYLCCITITCEMCDTRNPILLSDSSMSYLIIILIGLHVYTPPPHICLHIVHRDGFQFTWTTFFVGLQFNPVILNKTFRPAHLSSKWHAAAYICIRIFANITFLYFSCGRQLSNHWKKYVKGAVAQHLLRMSDNYTLQRNILWLQTVGSCGRLWNSDWFLVSGLLKCLKHSNKFSVKRYLDS